MYNASAPTFAASSAPRLPHPRVGYSYTYNIYKHIVLDISLSLYIHIYIYIYIYVYNLHLGLINPLRESSPRPPDR